jgi:hypothetical protein
MMGDDEYLPDPESAGPAPHLEHPGATRSGPRDVGCNAGEERAEQPAQRVVDGGIADEDSSWHPVPLGGPADWHAVVCVRRPIVYASTPAVPSW